MGRKPTKNIESAPKPIEFLNWLSSSDGEIAVVSCIVRNPNNGRIHSVLLYVDGDEWSFMCGCEHFIYSQNGVLCKHIKAVLLHLLIEGDKIWQMPIKRSIERNQPFSIENAPLVA